MSSRVIYVPYIYVQSEVYQAVLQTFPLCSPRVVQMSLPFVHSNCNDQFFEFQISAIH